MDVPHIVAEIKPSRTLSAPHKMISESALVLIFVSDQGPEVAPASRKRGKMPRGESLQQTEAG